MCKHARVIERRADGSELYECDVRDIRFRSGAQICLLCKSLELDSSEMPQGRFLRLSYSGSGFGDAISCNWRIIASKDIMTSSEMEKIKKWVDERAKTSGQIDFVRLRDYIFNLEISGRGHDNRCTWCGSFRTALKNHFGDSLEQTGNCPISGYDPEVIEEYF